MKLSRLHDKLVLILSEHSMNSDWVTHEIRRTRKHEKAEGKQKLFPISITPYENIEAWELFAPETVTDLADEIRSYFIPDFLQMEAGPRQLSKGIRPAAKRAQAG